jgi:hypothetical protein
MALSHPLSATRAAISLLAAAVIAVALATPAFAQASTTTTGPSTTTTTTPSTSTTALTTTSTTTTTTAPHGPPTTLVDPKKLAGLLKSLNADLARMNAVQAFAQAKKKAAAVAAGGPAAAAALSTTVGDAAATAAVAAADADLVRAAADQLAAAGAKKSAQDAVISARHRLHELAVAYYVHADVGAGSKAQASDGTTSPDGSVMLGLLLPQERDQLSQADHALTKAAKDQVSSKAHADRLVAVQVAAALAEAKRLAAEATTTTTTAVPAATTGTGPPPAASTRAPSPYAGAGLSILGPPAVTAAELAAWYTSTGHKAATTVPLATLTALYQASGVTYGVRDDIAFTQSIIETGYFGFPAGGQEHTDNNNFAGIGACDSCAGGNQFSDAKTGVDAQLQLLQHYAGSQPMPGPMALTAGPTGCCPTWMALTGVWASNPNYGFQILSLYKHILEWVLPRRSATAGL